MFDEWNKFWALLNICRRLNHFECSRVFGLVHALDNNFFDYVNTPWAVIIKLCIAPSLKTNPKPYHTHMFELLRATIAYGSLMYIEIQYVIKMWWVDLILFLSVLFDLSWDDVGIKMGNWANSTNSPRKCSQIPFPKCIICNTSHGLWLIYMHVFVLHGNFRYERSFVWVEIVAGKPILLYKLP